MDIQSIEPVIAARELKKYDGKKVEILIGKPRPMADGQDYFCPYKIDGVGNGRVSYAMGIDGIQALLLALQKIGADLYTSKEMQQGELEWMGGGERDLGFPLPDSIKDLGP